MMFDFYNVKLGSLKLERFSTNSKTDMRIVCELGKISNQFMSVTLSSNVRVNYTGQWVEGEREGNGTTSFRDGAVYTGQYRYRTVQ